MAGSEKETRQMSDAFINAVFLTASGGFQDAYTYCLRGHVFANAQTGNILLMSTYIVRKDLTEALYYLIPLCAFAAGIFAAEAVHRLYKQLNKIHWRQIILIFEILILFFVGFLPSSVDVLANAAVSFVCAMQVQSFRKFKGKAYASTMCIGNIRSGVEALCTYCHTKDRQILKIALEYFAIIFMFAAGAGIGSIFVTCFGIKAIWCSCLLLLASFCIMMRN